MLYTVQVKVMPLKELLDPQGKAVMGGLANLGLQNVADVRIGKNITLQVEAENPDAAKKVAEEASKKLLANPVMEYFEIFIARMVMCRKAAEYLDAKFHLEINGVDL